MKIASKHLGASTALVCVFIPLVALAFVTSGGCALSKEQIYITYAPLETLSRVPGAAEVGVRVEVTDHRTKKNELGKKGTAPAIAKFDWIAPILAANDVAKVLQDAISGELETRGFDVSGDNVVVQVELRKLHNHFHENGFTMAAEAELLMNVRVQGSEGDLRFSRIVHGIGAEDSIVLGGKDAKRALDAALQDAVYKLVVNVEFIDALVASDH